MGAKKDWSGQKLNKLSFIENTGQKRGTRFLWKLECDCGNTVITTPNQVVSGRRTSCGCDKKSKAQIQIERLTGQKFNSLTFIKPTGERNGYRVVWEVLCDCGSINIVRFPSNITSGHTKTCGCSNGPKDWTGYKHNMLTFVRPTNTKCKFGHILWEVLCNCGNTVIRNPSDIIYGKTMSCGCYAKSGDNQRKYPKELANARHIWLSNYRECPFDIFLNLTQQDCHYCGQKPSNKAQKQNAPPFIYNGLDRKNSSGDHSPDNVVPCCWTCNTAKMDMPYDEFLVHIDRMYHHIHGSKVMPSL